MPRRLSLIWGQPIVNIVVIVVIVVKKWYAVDLLLPLFYIAGKFSLLCGTMFYVLAGSVLRR